MASAVVRLSTLSVTDRTAQCEQTARILAGRFAAAKCTGTDLVPAKPGISPHCATGEFFFVRRQR
jgi:hypothetical protein